MTPDAELALYRALVELGEVEDPGRFLSDALRLAVEATGARIGYLGIGPSPLERPLWHAAVGADDLEALLGSVSATIVRQAADGKVILTHDASRDARFDGAASVRVNRIDQVLAAPFGGGVLYLQGRTRPRPFGDDDVRLVRAFVRHLAPLAHQLRWKARWTEDPTRPHREALQVRGMAGRSTALARVLAQIRQVAPREVPLLLTGPSGTGKTVAARVIHDNSARRGGPFEATNCALLTGERLHADLFGALAGAYSGLATRRRGLVAAADRGTLFLDEIGELSPAAQSQLLTFLDHGRYRPLGSEAEQVADVRIIAASSRELTDPARFRADLYYRFTVTIDFPPLSHRLDDLPELATALVGQIAAEQKMPALPLDPSAYAWLELQPLPGNVRELKNLLVRAMFAAEADHASALSAGHFEPPPHTEPLERLHDVTEATRRRHVSRVLAACDGNVSRAAEVLGVNRTYLYDLIRTLGLSDPPDTANGRRRVPPTSETE